MGWRYSVRRATPDGRILRHRVALNAFLARGPRRVDGFCGTVLTCAHSRPEGNAALTDSATPSCPARKPGPRATPRCRIRRHRVDLRALQARGRPRVAGYGGTVSPYAQARLEGDPAMPDSAAPGCPTREPGPRATPLCRIRRHRVALRALQARGRRRVDGYGGTGLPCAHHRPEADATLPNSAAPRCPPPQTEEFR